MKQFFFVLIGKCPMCHKFRKDISYHVSSNSCVGDKCESFSSRCCGRCFANYKQKQLSRWDW